MKNSFCYEIDKFFYYIILGVICGVIFDFFAALRCKKTVKMLTVIIQDIFFYVIITLLTFFVMLHLNSAELRVYIFIAMLLGFVTYRITVSKRVVVLFFNIGNIIRKIVKVFITITIFPIFKIIRCMLKPLLFLKHKFLRKKLKFALTFKSFCFKIKCKVLKLFSGIKICKERKPCRKKQRPQKRV